MEINKKKNKMEINKKEKLHDQKEIVDSNRDEIEFDDKKKTMKINKIRRKKKGEENTKITQKDQPFPVFVEKGTLR